MSRLLASCSDVAERVVSRQDGTVPDATFEHPRLAQLYDPLDPDRGDLDVYVAIVDELGVQSVLDVGCGTGTLACTLAARGVDVVAVDPARAMLDVAATKRGAAQVQWIHGDATSLPALQVDAAVMTGNVAQVFVTDEAWLATLSGIRAAVRPGGCLVFESRVPARRLGTDASPNSLIRRSMLTAWGSPSRGMR
jgi:SAM-dependent methyltransferase